MKQPLVTIICLCYNHERFVAEALQSVFNQTYPYIQLIVIDDGSTDDSAQVIDQQLKNRSNIIWIQHSENRGYTKTLNEAISYVQGEWIIDLAADDVLLPTRVEEGLRWMSENGGQYQIHFSDAEIINESGKVIRKHSDRYPHHTIPQGTIYQYLIKRYFILSPTLMFHKKVITTIGGYDECLAFEDFDFLMRASRHFQFGYLPKPLIKKRIVAGSLSEQQFRRGNKQRWSTLIVCKKIATMNRTTEEHCALKARLRYEIRLSLKMFDWPVAMAFVRFYFRLSSPVAMLI